MVVALLFQMVIISVFGLYGKNFPCA